MKTLSCVLSLCLLAACGGGGDITVSAVPSKARAEWNVGLSEVRAIMATCYPTVDTVVLTDVYDGGRAHLWVGATTTSGPPFFTGGVDVGDPLVIFNNLPTCPQPLQQEAA